MGGLDVGDHGPRRRIDPVRHELRVDPELLGHVPDVSFSLDALAAALSETRPARRVLVDESQLTTG